MSEVVAVISGEITVPKVQASAPAPKAQDERLPVLTSVGGKLFWMYPNGPAIEVSKGEDTLTWASDK